MVRFHPHFAFPLLVREEVLTADAYRVRRQSPEENTPRRTSTDASTAGLTASLTADPRTDSTADPTTDSTAGPTAASAAGASVPDPFQDAEALEELEQQITTLAAHIHAATHRLLTLIAEFDRRRGWELGGHRSCAHWLSFRTGIDLGTAREKVRTARALTGLPQISSSMARGQLSFSQARALTRVATEGSEGKLLALARGLTTAQLERTLRAWRRGSREDEVEEERRRYRSRTLSVFPDDDGMYRVQGRLPAEVGALVMRAVEAASDALFQEKKGPEVSESERERAAAQLRADALGLLAERALAAGFGGTPGSEERAEEEGGVEGEETAEHGIYPCSRDGNGSTGAAGACRTSASRLPVPISGTKAERYQVILHVDPSTLMAGGEPGRSELEDGTRLSAETSRRLTCDAAIVRFHYGTDGSGLNVGRKRRTIPPALRRALEVRDRGCCFPGCRCRFTDAHHILHWADGGETRLSNCLLLCGFHHALVHEGGWKVDWRGKGRPVFFNPRGDIFFDGGWEPPELGDDVVEALVAENERRGVKPDPRTAGARWKREADIPDPIFFGATEALAETSA